MRAVGQDRRLRTREPKTGLAYGNFDVTVGLMIELREYLDEQGRSPFARWFDRLKAVPAAKVATALVRMEQGNLSNAQGVGGGILETKIHFGPGYRIYFGRDGETLVILLGGGTKRQQQKDIEIAKDRWRDYKRRKKKQE